MNFIYCEKCGQKFSDEFPRCPYCGNVRAEYMYRQTGNNCFNGNNPYGNPNTENPDIGNNPGRFQYRQRRTVDVLQLVLSVINIVTGVGFVFGIIALIFTLIALSAADDADEASKLNVAKVMNTIGLVLLIPVGMLLGYWFMMLFVFALI